MKHKNFKQIILIASLTALAGCSGFLGAHKSDVHQGNVVTQEMVDQLKPGMTERQVRFVMGTPLIVNSFDQNRWDYIYSTQRGGNPRTQETLSVLFENGELHTIAGDFRPNSGESNTVGEQQERTEQLLEDVTEEQKAEGVDPDANVPQAGGLGSPNISEPL